MEFESVMSVMVATFVFAALLLYRWGSSGDAAYAQERLERERSERLQMVSASHLDDYSEEVEEEEEEEEEEYGIPIDTSSLSMWSTITGWNDPIDIQD